MDTKDTNDLAEELALAQERQKTREFLEGLPLDKLAKLLVLEVFEDMVYEAAAKSETLSGRLQEIADAEFEKLPASEQQRIERFSVEAKLPVPKRT